MDNLLIYAIIYPVAGAAMLAVVISLTSRRVPVSWLWMITAAGVFASAVRLFYLMRSASWGIDHWIFWGVGEDIWAGIDPYSPSRYPTHPILNPPSTFPLFALIAALPFRTSLAVWSLIYTAIALGLVPLAWRILDAHQEGEAQGLSYPELGVLATAVALSDACMATIQLGQLALLATAFILLALYARSRDRPVIAGVAMGMATMKVGTMVPFLLLFHRRSDQKAWLALGATVILLIVLGGQPGRLIDHCRAMLSHVKELSQPGAVNDISYAGPYNEWIVGFDHLAYRLGVRDGTTLKLIQSGALFLIGLWLAAELVTRRIPWGLGLSLVSLYSVLFLYHRLYDTVMIVPALVYAFGRAKATSGRSHRLYAAAIILMLMVLYLRRKTLGQLTDWAVEHRGIAATLTEWFILPYGTWSILLAMVCLRLANVDSGDATSENTAGTTPIVRWRRPMD
jgi:hypothetical protein